MRKNPKPIRGRLKCPNPLCITNFEPVETVFTPVGKNSLSCRHCERSFTSEELA